MPVLGHDKRTAKSREAASKKMGLEATAEHSQWRCWRDVLRKTVPDTRDVGLRRPVKLGQRRLTAVYGGPPARMTRQNADDAKPASLYCSIVTMSL